MAQGDTDFSLSRFVELCNLLNTRDSNAMYALREQKH